MKISDIAEVINETVKEPSKSGIDVFVGLEHYDIAEPVIKRFGSTQMLSTAAKVFNKGDVLIARRNVYLQRSAMAPFSGLTSGDSIVLRVKDNFDTKETDYETMSKLLPFILNSIDFWDYANTNADGTMSKRLSPALLLDYEFDLPSIEEQKLRAEKLWAAYEVKQSYLKMIKATQEMVQSQFIEMFGTINDTKYPIGRIGDVAHIKHGYPFDGHFFSEKDNGVMLVTPGNFRIGGGFQEIKCKYFTSSYPNEYVLNPGDLIVTMTDLSKQSDTLGYGALVPDSDKVYLHNQRIGLFVDLDEKVDKRYLVWFLQTSEYRTYIVSSATGSIVKHTSPGRIMEAKVILPPKDIQQKFIRIVEQADKSEFELRKSIDAIDAVIKSLINS